MMMCMMGNIPRCGFVARAALGLSEYQTEKKELLPFTPSNLWDNTGNLSFIVIFNYRCQIKVQESW